jgi:hypothetical protein
MTASEEAKAVVRISPAAQGTAVPNPGTPAMTMTTMLSLPVRGVTTLRNDRSTLAAAEATMAQGSRAVPVLPK